MFAAWPRILDPEASSISTEDAALAAVSLLDIELRDAMVAWLCPGTLDLKELSQEVQRLLSSLESTLQVDDIDAASTGAQNAIQARLIRLCAMLPDDLAAPALSLLASFTWWRGDGALARVALARALRCDPEYRLALLLQQMVERAMAVPRSAIRWVIGLFHHWVEATGSAGVLSWLGGQARNAASLIREAGIVPSLFAVLSTPPMPAAAATAARFAGRGIVH